MKYDYPFNIANLGDHFPGEDFLSSIFYCTDIYTVTFERKKAKMKKIFLNVKVTNFSTKLRPAMALLGKEWKFYDAARMLWTFLILMWIFRIFSRRIRAIFFTGFIETVTLSSVKFTNASSLQFISIYSQVCYINKYFTCH